MTHPRCKSCPKWSSPNLSGLEVDLHNPPRGECHARPPTVLAAFVPGRNPQEIGVKPFLLWPQTSHNDWCGEHPDFGLRKGDSAEKEHRETYGRNSSSPLP